MDNAIGYYIGNDIVAFPKQGEKPKYQNQRWLDKVFTPKEQLFIANSANPDQTLWWLWSCKESAYKVFFKIEKIVLPEVYFRISCSKGTYIRSIAHDFGKALSAGAYLKALRRTKIGNYQVENAVQVESFEGLANQHSVGQIVKN